MTMALFFFDIYNDDTTVDEEGIEIPDAPAARERAVREARILACETIRQRGVLNLSHRIVVRDAENREIAVVRFGDAIDIVE